MQAVKVFNNNAVSVVMPDGREAILVGNGLGFGRRPGDVIDKNRVSKVYYVQNELQTKFLRMLDNVTPQVMQAAERISLAAEEQGILLGSKSTISLVDHISFALERVEKGTFLPNLVLSETRMLYPKEYAVGQRALELVRQFCGVQLPEDVRSEAPRRKSCHSSGSLASKTSVMDTRFSPFPHKILLRKLSRGLR